MKRRIITYAIISLTLFAGIMLFLWLRCPQYLMYHEQYQLFLFTWDYFVSSISTPGGLADYLSEFVVQFYYVPVYGAALAALTLTLSQMFLGLTHSRSRFPEASYCLSTIPPILFVGAMSNENILFSFAMAMLLTSLAIYLCSLSEKRSPVRETLTLICSFILLYWCAGPLAFVLIVAVGIMRKDIIPTAISLTAAIIIVCGIHALWFGQYPLSRMLLGINYYRVPEMYPTIFYVIAGIIALLPLISCYLISPFRGSGGLLPSLAAILLAIIYVSYSFDKEKSRILTYDSLVRRGDWSGIIDKASKEKPSDSFSLQALNLALGMTGQLPDKMFRYDQSGMDGLIDKNRLDNTSPLITAETLFRLGLTNIAFSTTFDIQEAIMNDRKSGRFMKRMAECMIINGNYKVAGKYIGMLSKSLFYSDWARHASTLLNNDSAVDAHRVYGPLRRNAFKQTVFYDHTQIEKILAMLAAQSNGANKLAWQYFCAAAMLKGDLNTLIGIYNNYADIFGDSNIPRHVQEAMAMYWTFSHNSFEGIPFPISGDVRQQTSNLARAAMGNQDNPSAWKAAAPGSYGVYFLINSKKSQNSSPSDSYQPTHE